MAGPTAQAAQTSHPAHLRRSPVATVRGLLDAAHVGPAVVVTAAAGLLGVAAGLDAAALAVVIGAVLMSQLTIGWSNDLVDLARDRAVSRDDKPLVAGVVSVTTVRVACGVALVACVPLSIACGWRAALVSLVCTAGGWAYNLGLKATVWSWLPYIVTFGALPLLPALATGSDGLPGWLVPAGALLGVAAHLLNVVPDLDDDAATGVRGLPHRLGARVSVVGAVAVLVASSVVVALAAVRDTTGGVVGVVLGLAVVAALAGTALLGHGRTPFRAAMLIVLADVLLVAWVL